ncbi:hypothetical protein ACROYT_G032215 [Oculina patagonica]
MSKWMLWITEVFTWMYIGTQDVWAIFIIALYVSKYGNIKLGKPDDKPVFNDLTYFKMLFAADIGIGLFYFGVEEYEVVNIYLNLHGGTEGDIVSRLGRLGKARAAYANISKSSSYSRKTKLRLYKCSIGATIWIKVLEND